MSFLKNNLIAVILSLFALGGVSFANTYVRPYNSTNYAGGSKAVGAVVNAEFQSITDWLNGGNIATGNIAALGVATGNIAGGAVTPAKMARLSNANTSLITGSPFTTVSTTATVTGLEFTITTSGRPVVIFMRGSILNPGSSYFAVVSSTSTNLYGDVFLYRDGSQLDRNRFGSSVLSAGAMNRFYASPTSFVFVDNPLAGTYTYSIRASVGDAANELSINEVQVIAYEL